jgi:outer membrane murein-binding lipoprotein Lpp
MADLPGWDSLSAVTRYHSWAEVAGIVSLALLVAAEALGYMYGHRKDDLEAMQQQRHEEEVARLRLDTETARSETAKANEAAAKANERAAELKLALDREIAARQARTITEDQHDTLVAALRSVEKCPVFVLPKRFDEEAEGFAAKIYEVLRDAGFETPEWKGQSAFGFGVPGVVIFVKDAQHPPPAAGAIQRTFQTVAEVTMFAAEKTDLPNGAILLGVSSHP